MATVSAVALTIAMHSSVFGSSRLVSLQYIEFVTLPPHKPWLRPSQAKARPKPTSMAWPEDPGSQSHSKPSQNITRR